MNIENNTMIIPLLKYYFISYKIEIIIFIITFVLLLLFTTFINHKDIILDILYLLKSRGHRRRGSSSGISFHSSLLSKETYKNKLNNNKNNKKRNQFIHSNYDNIHLLNINESVIQYIDHLGTNNMEGYLWKKGQKIKSWKRRYFILDSNGKLKYYSNADDVRQSIASKGSLIVDSTLSMTDKERQFGIKVFGTLGRAYYLSADDIITQQKWLVALTKRAMETSIPGRILIDEMDPENYYLNDNINQNEPMKHTLNVIIDKFYYNKINFKKQTSYRHYYIVIKYKSEIHECNHIPVKQTNNIKANLYDNINNYISWSNVNGNLNINSNASHLNSQKDKEKDQNNNINQDNKQDLNEQGEKFTWSFYDHECDKCIECMAVGITKGYYLGLPQTIIIQLWEATLLKDRKIGTTKISLNDLFGYIGIEKSNITCSWPVLHHKNIIVGRLKIHLNYILQKKIVNKTKINQTILNTNDDNHINSNEKNKLIYTFLTSSETDMDLVYTTDIDFNNNNLLLSTNDNNLNIKNGTNTNTNTNNNNIIKTFFNLFFENENNNVWKIYHTNREDTDIEVSEWISLNNNNNNNNDLNTNININEIKKRNISFRCLTHAPIGPTTTRCDVNQLYYINTLNDIIEIIILQITTLEDIPYGDCFTVESKTIIKLNNNNNNNTMVNNNNNNNENKIKIEYYVSIPFTKGCMWKSRIISTTIQQTKDSTDQLYNLIKKSLNNTTQIQSIDTNPLEKENSQIQETNVSKPLENIIQHKPSRRRTGNRMTLSNMNDNINNNNMMIALEEIFENQRISIFGRWGPNHLLPTDRPRFSNRQGDIEVDFNSIVPPSPDWHWTSDWKVDFNYTICDEQGWSYATDFPRFTSHLKKEKSSSKRLGASVRRRRWIRTLCYQPINTGNNNNNTNDLILERNSSLHTIHNHSNHSPVKSESTLYTQTPYKISSTTSGRSSNYLNQLPETLRSSAN